MALGEKFEKLDGSLKFDKPGPGMMEVPMADISWVKDKYLDIEYGTESKNQRLDLYLPETGVGPFPVLWHIHGGGFGLGDKRDDHMNTYLKFLKKGIAVGSIEYRLSGEAIFPAAVLDCRAAIRFMKKHASEYRVDAEKFLAIGGSAGGNLAAMLAMNIKNGEFTGEEGMSFDSDCTVIAAIDQFGPIDFAVMDDQAEKNGVSFKDHNEPFSAESSYLGAPLKAADPDMLATSDPITYISEAMCPLLVQHGCMDKLVPYAQSVELVEAIAHKGLGDRVEFITLPTADHEDKQYGTEENLKKIWAFIQKNLERK